VIKGWFGQKCIRRVRSIDVKEKYIKPTRVFELEDGVGIYRNRRR